MKPKIDDINSMIKEILLRFAPQEGYYATPLESVTIHRRDSPTEKVNITFYRPVIVLMVQGDKHSVLGSEKCHYGKNDCLIVGVDIPSISRIVEASPEKPCLTISIEIDKYITTQLAAEISPVSKLSNASYKAMAIIPSDIELLDAFYRLAKLIDNQEQISIMAPMIIREIHYRLLTCPIGEHLKMINTPRYAKQPYRPRYIMVKK